MIKHIILANPALLSMLKQAKGWKRGRKDPLQLLAEEIPINRIKEKPWLEKMRKRIS